MHLQVSIALLLILLTGGFSLNCYDCPDQVYCSRGKTCYNDKCRSTRTVEYYGPYREQADNLQRERDRIPNRIKNKHATCPGKDTRMESKYNKGCAMAHECKSWSIGTGCWTKEHVSECCDTNNCNEQAPVLTAQIPNGKRCFTCDEEDCSKTISCWGNEDHCFIAYETSSQQSVATKGCASKSACDQELGRTLGLHENISCCEGNLCNGAQSVTQSFLFLCCSLLSYFLLH